MVLQASYDVLYTNILIGTLVLTTFVMFTLIKML